MKRGFTEEDVAGNLKTLPPPNSLEDQLLDDGHEQLLREILAEIGGNSALTCPFEEFIARLKNDKSGYMGVLSLRVAENQALAQRMPAAFVNLVTSLRDGAA